MKKSRPSVDPPARPIDRRSLLAYASASGLALVLATHAPASARIRRSERNGPWGSRRTWGGSIPSKRDVVVIAHDVRLDRSRSASGVIVNRGATLLFNPSRTVVLTSTGNVVIKGRLVAHPNGPSIRHQVLFAGVRESRFKGGGMRVIRNDVGLWVMDQGALDLAGSAKVPWLRAAGSVPAGTSTIELDGDPVGWRVGDEISLTPTGTPEADDHYDAFDTSKITAISGRSISLARPTRHAHPQVDAGNGNRMCSEVLNLTRNVVIGGRPGGRSHVFIHSRRPQRIRQVLIRNNGPRRRVGLVGGRYGLHFHHCLGGSRGSEVTGVVVRNSGSHSFVPHLSHGIAFRGCIAFDVVETAYWWDAGDTSNNITYERCVAAKVRVAKGTGVFRLAGFLLPKGSGSRAVGCVATGVRGGGEAAGFSWPGAKSQGVWGFTDCVGHNNKASGIFVWVNSHLAHIVNRFVGFHNGRAGINHGAYGNGFLYRDSSLYGNRRSSIELRARSSGKRQLRFINLRCDGAGLSEHAITTNRHLGGSGPVLFQDCDFRGFERSAFGFTLDRTREPDRIDILNCAFSGNEFWVYDSAHIDSLIRFQSGGEALALRHPDSDGPGTFRTEWNAKVSSIAPFG